MNLLSPAYVWRASRVSPGALSASFAQSGGGSARKEARARQHNTGMPRRDMAFNTEAPGFAFQVSRFEFHAPASEPARKRGNTDSNTVAPASSPAVTAGVSPAVRSRGATWKRAREREPVASKAGLSALTTNYQLPIRRCSVPAGGGWRGSIHMPPPLRRPATAPSGNTGQDRAVDGRANLRGR